jgi:hypothetical protein
VLQGTGALEVPDLVQPTDRAVVDEDVGHRLASRAVRQPGAQSGVVGGVDHLEALTPSHEEASSEPAAPGAGASVEHYLHLVHSLFISLMDIRVRSDDRKGTGSGVSLTRVIFVA